MTTSTARVILKQCVPLIPKYGFTREAIAQAALTLPDPHPHPLSDTAISAMFGKGDMARRTLINAWMDEGVRDMNMGLKQEDIASPLKRRLDWNKPVLPYLAEAFALLATPSSNCSLPVDPRPALKHVTRIADEACILTSDTSTGNAWYFKRAELATIYILAELNQISSPSTADSFLNKLLSQSTEISKLVSETSLFADYVVRSWRSLLKSNGMF